MMWPPPALTSATPPHTDCEEAACLDLPAVVFDVAKGWENAVAC